MQKTFDSAKIYKVCLKVAISVLLVLIVAFVPTIIIIMNSPIQEDHFVKKSEYQGVVELWNIDCFEGGTGSKASFLSARAIEYEKNNQGFYVMVKNMTVEEFLLAISQNQMPTMISFSGGVAKDFENLLQPLEKSFAINSNVLDSAKIADKLCAVGWCHGGYALISTMQKVPMLEYDKLHNLSLASGTITTSKKGQQKITYSLVFGAKNTNPVGAYQKECGELTNSQTAFSKDCYNKTAYQAYCDFVENKANILLGTQRDISRIENRKSQGKIDNVVYEFLGGQTDLVQYVGLTTKVDGQEKEQCLCFIDYLVSDIAQSKLANIGMFSVKSQTKLYEQEPFASFEKAFEKDCEIPKIFEN